MKRVKIVKVFYAYNERLEEYVVSSVMEGLPWAEVTEEDFKDLQQLVKNKHKIKELHDFNLWLLEEPRKEEGIDFSVEGLLNLYREVAQKERDAAEKRRLAKEARERAKELSEIKKKKALLKKLKEELGDA